MGCTAARKEVIENTQRQSLSVAGQIDDPHIDILLGIRLNDLNYTKELRKFGFFDVEEHGLGDQPALVKPFIEFHDPNDIENTKPTSLQPKLTIEYVFGYSSDFIRHNVFFTRNIYEIVYSAGCLGVILNTENNTQKIFGGGNYDYSHTGNIKSLAYNISQNIIASGEISKMPKIIIWKINNTVQSIKTLTLEKGTKSVDGLSFSANGQFLLSVVQNSNHYVQIWDWERSEKTFQKNLLKKKILDLSWNSNSLMFSVVGENFISIWSSTESSIFDCTECFPQKEYFVITCVRWIQEFTYTGSKDGKVCKWKGKTLVLNEPVHSPYAIHCMLSNNNYLYTGSRDNTVRIMDADLIELKTLHVSSVPRAFDIRASYLLCGLLDGNIVQIITNVEENQNQESFKVLIHGHGDVLTDLIASNTSNSFFSISKDCYLKAWDFENCSLIAQLSLNQLSSGSEFKATVLAIQNDSDVLAIGFADGTLIIIESNSIIKQEKSTTGLSVKQKINLNEPIKALSFSPSSEFLLAGCQSGFIIVLSIPNLFFIKKIPTGFSSFHSIDWSKESETIRVCSSLLEVLIIDMKSLSVIEIEDISSINDKVYDTWTSGVGWPVEKFYKDLFEISNIKIVNLDKNSNFLAIGKEIGEYIISSFPYHSGFQEQVYLGHSSKLKHLKKTSPNSFLLSWSSNQVILKWKVKQLENLH